MPDTKNPGITSTSSDLKSKPSASNDKTSKYFTHLSDSEDFKTPKAINKVSKIQRKKAVKKPKTQKNTVNLRKFLEQNLNTGDTNPEHLQLALALSDSEQPSSEEKRDDFRKALAKFGFGYNRGTKTDLFEVAAKAVKKSKFRYVTPVLKLRTSEERATIITSRINKVLEKNFQEPEVVHTAIEPQVDSQVLQGYVLNKIFPLNSCTLSDFTGRFYVDGLNLEQASSSCGVLLKNWRKIQGRDLSPVPEDRGLNIVRGEPDVSSAQEDRGLSPIMGPDTRCQSPDLFESDPEDTKQTTETYDLCSNSNSDTEKKGKKYSLSSDSEGESPHFLHKSQENVLNNLRLKYSATQKSASPLTIDLCDSPPLVHENTEPCTPDKPHNDPEIGYCSFFTRTFTDSGGRKSFDGAESSLKLKGSPIEATLLQQSEDLDQNDSKSIESVKSLIADKHEPGKLHLSQDENLLDASCASNANLLQGNQEKVSLKSSDLSEDSSQLDDDELQNSSFCSRNLQPIRKQVSVEPSDELESSGLEGPSVKPAVDLAVNQDDVFAGFRFKYGLGLNDSKFQSPDSLIDLSQDTSSDRICVEEPKPSTHDQDFSPVRNCSEAGSNLNITEYVQNLLRSSESSVLEPSGSGEKLEKNTPVSSKFSIKTKNITPMPHYDEMNTPTVVKELDKFGIKPLKRCRGARMLKYIYEATHPFIVDEDGKRVKKARLDNGDLIREIPEDDELFFERRQLKSVASCQVPLHIVWHNFIMSNPDIREKILLYEPLQLDALHSLLKEQGYKFHIQDLLTFLDRKCITVRLTQR